MKLALEKDRSNVAIVVDQERLNVTTVPDQERLNVLIAKVKVKWRNRIHEFVVY